MADRPRIESRYRRLVAYLRHNRDQIVVDAAILLTWAVVTAAVFHWLVLPQWLHYLVLFAGIGIYVPLTPDWAAPDSSPP